MKLSKRLKENKKLYNYIENKLRGNKDAYMGEGTDVKLILNDKKKLINAFISRNKGLQREYNELKDENQNFYNTYKNILNFRDNQAFLLKKFKDNIIYYQKNGYKIPNLTTKSNIIKYSPLLMEGQEHINKFYLQDLYSLNKQLKKIWPYNKIQKYLLENNITFNGNTEEDDDNEKEGINSILLLKNSDLVAKTTFKELKSKRIYKSLDISNWFKQDLYADPFLTQGNSIYADSIFDIDRNEKRNILNKEIERLNTYNEKLKEDLYKMDNYGNDSIKTDTSKRHSVFIVKSNKNENSNNFRINSNYKNRSKKKKLSLPHKTKNNMHFEDFYKNIIADKSKKNENKTFKFKIENKGFISPPKNYFPAKKHIIKKHKNSFIKNNKSSKIINNNFKLDNIYNIEKFKKNFIAYSDKEPKALFSLINDIKEPFNRPNILNIFNKKFKLSKINELKSRYSFLEKYLCKGLISNNFSS